jgi:hypothetical protein
MFHILLPGYLHKSQKVAFSYLKGDAGNFLDHNPKYMEQIADLNPSPFVLDKQLRPIWMDWEQKQPSFWYEDRAW